MKDIINQCGLVYEMNGVPKGRGLPVNLSNCRAIRSFEEETDLSKNEYTLLDNVSPLTEELLVPMV